MAGQSTVCRISKPIAGAVLVGLGMFILYENLAGAAACLAQVLSANGSEALGFLSAVILAASQAADYKGFLQGFVQHMLATSWPLLLVLVGTVLSRDAFMDQ